jgi:raffinose/stachyose/melibiose transport system substrate-binding protein
MLHTANIENEPTFNAVWKGFQKAYPNIKVQYIGNESPEEQIKKIKLAAESKKLPDVFWVLDPVAKELAANGYLLDINKIIALYPAISQKVPESMIKGFSQNGIIYGLPYQCNVEGFWVDKAIFKKYGVNPPTQGTNFDELMAMVRIFSKNGVTTIINGAKSPYSCWAFLTAWARYGYYDHISGILAGKDKFENPDFLRYFDKLAQLQKAGAFLDNITTTEYTQAIQYFSMGKGAMYDCGSWAAGSPEFAKLGDNIDFWWGPVFTDGVGNQKVSMKIPSAPLCVSAAVANDPKKLAAVAAFFNFYFASRDATRLTIETGSVPVAKIEGTVPKTNIKGLASILNALTIPDWSSPAVGPDMLVSTAVQNVMYDSIYGVMSGVYTPQQALKNLDAAQSQVKN